MSTSGSVDAIRRGSQLHQRNCCAYFTKLLPLIHDKLMNDIEQLDTRLHAQLTSIKDKDFLPTTDYAALYGWFLSTLEENSNQLLRSDRLDDAYQTFINALYDNDNDILDATYQSIKKPLAEEPRHTSSRGYSIVAHQARTWRDTPRIFTPTPAGVNHPLWTLASVIGPHYKPQHQTSLPTVRKYGYLRPGTSTLRELRFGTQAQIVGGRPRVCPLFESWLRGQKTLSQDESPPPFTHVYINNLGRDHTTIQGLREAAMTRVLEGMEKDHPNVAVITLPADGGLMSQSAFAEPRTHHAKKTRELFLAIAVEDQTVQANQPIIKDFHISNSVRQRLFRGDAGYSGETEKMILKGLIEKSFEALGYEKLITLSSAQRQAVYVHFIKFSLTDYILTTLKPKTMNFTCKDAIDRGGVSSAYYNLLKSIEAKVPLTRAEFDMAIHAAPAMVKGRGMNYHIHILWNALDTYVNKNYETLSKDEESSWLIDWCDQYCPDARLDELLATRKRQVEEQLKSSKQSVGLAAQDVLNKAEKNSRQMDAAGKRAMLEAVTLTGALLHKPSDTQISERYQTLGNEIALKLELSFFAKLLARLLQLIMPNNQREAAPTEPSPSTFKSKMEVFRSRVNKETPAPGTTP